MNALSRLADYAATRNEVLAEVLEAIEDADRRQQAAAHFNMGSGLGWEAARDIVRLMLNPAASSTAPDFFQPGHGYTHLDGHDFLCVTVTTHPRTGRLYAMGWISEGGQLHRPAVEDINAWRHEYDGCQPPDEGPDGAYASTRGEPGGDA